MPRLLGSHTKALVVAPVLVDGPEERILVAKLGPDVIVLHPNLLPLRLDDVGEHVLVNQDAAEAQPVHGEDLIARAFLQVLSQRLRPAKLPRHAPLAPEVASAN